MASGRVWLNCRAAEFIVFRHYHAGSWEQREAHFPLNSPSREDDIRYQEIPGYYVLIRMPEKSPHPSLLSTLPLLCLRLWPRLEQLRACPPPMSIYSAPINQVGQLLPRQGGRGKAGGCSQPERGSWQDGAGYMASPTAPQAQCPWEPPSPDSGGLVRPGQW